METQTENLSPILIRGGRIIDGTGGKSYVADILVENGRIRRIAPDQTAPQAQILDASKLVVTPGFVDIHRHCDLKPLNDPAFGDCMLQQGITTTVVGNCGISATPCSTDEKCAKEMQDFDEPVLGPGMPSLCTYHQYRELLSHTALPVNFAAMIGTGSVRIAVKGFSSTPYTAAEMEKAQALIEDALEQGAPGISLGIMYLPECYSSVDEFVALLKAVGRRHRVITTHIRGEGDSMVASVREVIEIARRADCALEISHFKSCGMKNWRKDIHTAIHLIEEAQRAGQDVGCDFYPYNGGSTSLITMIPPAFVSGDISAALQKMGSPSGVHTLREALKHTYADWDNFAITLGWDRILISGVKKEYNRQYIGKTVAQAATEYGYEDPAAFVAALLHDEDGKVAIINMSMCQDDIDTVARLPYSSVISDSIYAQTDTPHPRLYGAFPKIIREYVGERHLLTLESAIRKMTSLPAARMHLTGRGLLMEGNYADINLFDPAVFRDNATFERPTLQASGLACCIENGRIALRDGCVLQRNCGVLLSADT